MNHPVILAIETSVGPCSVTVTRGHEVLAQDTVDDFHQQSKMLVPMCERVLGNASMTYSDLNGIASSCGPGSFTSIRVGLAAAKAMAFGAGKPFYGVSTLEALAFSAKDKSALPILVALNAHRNEAYAQCFSSKGEPTGEAVVLPVSILTERFNAPEYLLVGNHQESMLEAFKGCRQSDITIPSAIMVAKLALHKLEQHPANEFLSSPVYIRPPDAKLPSTAGA